MSVIDELRLRASTIKREEEEGQNTALRVGGLLYDIIDYVDSATGGHDPQPSDKTTVVVTPLYNRGVQVASIQVDNVNTTLWAPEQGGGGTPYDDTVIKRQINTLNDVTAQLESTISQEQTRLDGVIQEIDTEVSQKIDSLYDDAQWIQNMFPEHKVTWQSGWDAQLEAYLQRVGVWARNNGITQTQWSQITQKVDSLESSVNSVTEEADRTITAVSSTINQSVANEVARYNIDATYAKKDVQDVILWMYSALKGGASGYSTWNQLVSAGQAGANSAVSEVRTQVERVRNNEFVATGSFETKVNDTIAGLYQRATPSSASLDLFTQVKKNASQISSWYSAGVVLQSDLNSAKASLVAKNEYNAATITAMINSAGSSVSIAANKINLTADAINAVSKTADLQVKDLIIYGDRILFNKSGSTTKTIIQNGWGNFSLGVVAGLHYSSDMLKLVSAGDMWICLDDDVPDCTLYLGKSGTIYYGGEGAEIERRTCSIFRDIRATADKKFVVTAEDVELNGDISLNGTVTCKDKINFTSTNGSISASNKVTLSTGGTLYFTGGFIDMNAAQIHANVPITTGSDIRQKDIIKELSPAIEDIAKARIVDYVYKEYPDIVRAGTIAQDWENVIPNAVKQDSSGFLSLDYSAAALISAVEAAREIIALKEENRLLKERLERLESLIEEK